MRLPLRKQAKYVLVEAEQLPAKLEEAAAGFEEKWRLSLAVPNVIYARGKFEGREVYSFTSRATGRFFFWLCGLDKIHTEFGIVAIAYNLLKVTVIRFVFFGKRA